MDVAGKAVGKSKEVFVIGASSLGTMFEWYDFFLYGALATHIARHFFSGVDETTGFILALAAFAAGFIVRPIGALLFGRLGDVSGRKRTFLITMALMGASTFAVGLLPSYAEIGLAAPIILVLLRLCQGLAIGGEYGGAVIYVAEHAPNGKRGLQTSWIQTTAALGLLLSLFIIMATRSAMGKEAFEHHGWRIPFLLSIFLLGISLWIRIRLNESPVFQKMKAEAATSRAPFQEAFGKWKNLKVVLIALFGAVAGQAVTFYTGTFYVLYFLERSLKVDGQQANALVAVALVIGAPLYVFWGWLSDRIGRRPIILGGLAAAALLYFPLFGWLTIAANPALAAAQKSAPVTVTADPAQCSFQFDPVGRTKFDRRPCDVAKSYLARAGVGYSSVNGGADGGASIDIGAARIAAPRMAGLSDAARAQAIAAFQAEAARALASVGYPASADPRAVNQPLVIAIIVMLMNITAMAYGPMAAMLVEMFPARVRYTSMSLPYHIGNGWFGGFLPTTAFAIVAATGNALAGLWYPVVVAGGTLALGLVFLKETRGAHIEHANFGTS